MMPAQANQVSDDSIMIRSSVLVVTPGDVLYSCIGHAFIRMECPTYGLDYCFTCESESVRQKVLTFLAGHLKMGMMAIPTGELLNLYASEKRGVSEYNLNLTLEQNRRLWELLDNTVAKGMDLPYDYMQRGCALSCYRIIMETIQRDGAVEHRWPAHFYMTRRELVSRQMGDFPWTAFMLYSLVGKEADKSVPFDDKVVTPRDLLEVLQLTTVNKSQLLDNEGSVLIEAAEPAAGGDCELPSPLICSWVVLVICICSILKKSSLHEYLLLVLQFSIGLFLFYLIFCSSLPCTEWNWLFIPFNPLPVFTWRWRKTWAAVYAAALLVWLLAMLLSPHQLVDSAYLMLAFCLLITCLNIHVKLNTKLSCLRIETSVSAKASES